MGEEDPVTDALPDPENPTPSAEAPATDAAPADAPTPSGEAAAPAAPDADELPGQLSLDAPADQAPAAEEPEPTVDRADAQEPEAVVAETAAEEPEPTVVEAAAQEPEPTVVEAAPQEPEPTVVEAAPQDPEPTVAEPAAEDEGFAALGLRDELLEALNRLGYEEPTPIQREAIVPLLAGRDVLGQAATGTGKTAAFALPLLQALPEWPRGPKPSALVLAPTRELAMQVSEATHNYGRALGARVLPVYGGTPIGRQLRSLERGVDVVVATPGRALDLLNRGALDLSGLRTLVLDEADEMLDMGFAEDLEELFAAVPEQRQAVLFSATMPRRIARLADEHLDDPVRIRLEREKPVAGEAPAIRQLAYVVPRSHKAAALGRVLDMEQPTAAIVFCRTRAEVDELTASLNGRGFRAEALHGGIDQEGRSRVVERLKGGTTELVVATDVAARGLDVETLTHVVNYDLPSAPEAYVHRIGRVGRAGRAGTAITLAQPREHRMLKQIERATGAKVSIEGLPTVADLRAKRAEQTVAALREAIIAGDLDHQRVVVEALAEEHDPLTVALAAVKLLEESGGTADDEGDIPDAAHRWSNDRGDRRERGDRRDRGDRGDRGERHGRDRGDRAPRERGNRGPDGPTTELYVGLGRKGGVRPQDIVGAFTGESSISGREIGSIKIHDHFSFVEVPAGRADEVLAALQDLTMRGRRVAVRR
jgi:ATP-dependent RNA helicase DeaD